MLMLLCSPILDDLCADFERQADCVPRCCRGQSRAAGKGAGASFSYRAVILPFATITPPLITRNRMTPFSTATSLFLVVIVMMCLAGNADAANCCKTGCSLPGCTQW